MSIRINGDNTTAAPGIAKGDDTDTGIQFGTDEVSIVTGGTERVKVDSSGIPLIRTSTPRTNQGGGTRSFGVQIEGNSFDEAGVSILRTTNDAGTPHLTFEKTRSTGDTIVQDEDPLGVIHFEGNDGTNFIRAARIQAFVSGTPGTNNMPGRIIISTTPEGSDTSINRYQIDNRGQTLAASDGTPSVDHMMATSAGSSTSSKVLSLRRSATLGSLGTGAEVCVFRRNGDVDNTNNSYGSLSDVKLKENIVDANSQWEDFKNLQIRNYNYKAETGNDTHTQIGLIAQEAELICPGLVKEIADLDDQDNDLGTTTKYVNYSVLYMKAVKALQEAIERIETLEAKVAALEAN